MKQIQNYTKAKDELRKLFEKYADYENEAEVRFHFIDEFLENVYCGRSMRSLLKNMKMGVELIMS